MKLREWLIGFLSYPDTRVSIRDLEGRMKQIEDRYIYAREEQRQDFQERLGEKDARIRELRTEVASLKLECDRMRTAFIQQLGYAQFSNLSELAGIKPPPVPAFDGPDDWQAELNKIYAKEKSDGISGEGRKEVHEPAPDAGA